MAAAVALSNYQLGDILGRGASGSVYRALNFLTGETVAIKSISLLSLPPSSLPDIMSEIDLLKNLNHPNIVKYKGFARDKENLFIVLEYCENGSLQTILKKFGKFPESLVAVYISQVLQGLIYLHEQGVIHRDIKGANILTNKDGSVKLADFGVSSRTTQPSLEYDSITAARPDNDNEVVGSPYWMAPEVIEQSGASTASDIWSVGCVVVELLEGKPPYGDLAPMQALWRIVQDESMKIPEGASPIVKDFLYHCFQKDPNLRVSAKKLLRHPWMLSVKKSTEPPAVVTSHHQHQPGDRLVTANDQRLSGRSHATLSPQSGSQLQPQAQGQLQPQLNGQKQNKSQIQTPSQNQGRPQSRATSARISSGGSSKPKSADSGTNVSQSSGGSGGGTVRAKKPMTVYDEAVQRVQEWNEALNASPKALGTMRRLPLPQPRKQSVSNVRQRGESNGPLGLFALPSRSLGDAISSQLTGAVSGNVMQPGQMAMQPGLIGKNLHVSDVLSRAKESETAGESWDDDFASDITLSKLGHRREESAASEDLNQKTLRPMRTPSSSGKAPSALPAGRLLPGSASQGMNGRIENGSSARYVEDYSDIGLGEDDDGLETKLGNLKLKTQGRKGLFHPDDIRKIPLSPKPFATQPQPQPQRALSTPAKQQNHNQIFSSPTLPVPQSPSPRIQARSPPSSRQNSLRGKGTPGGGVSGGGGAGDNDGVLELNKYSEKEDEDYEDIFESVQPAVPSGSKDRQSLQLTRRSNRSWVSDGDDEDPDPFAEIDDDFNTEDLEANLLRDKRATLCANVNKLVDGLVPNTPSSALKDGCDELLSLLENAPAEMGLEAHFVSQHGLLATLEVLESRLSREVAVRLLKLVNMIVISDVELLESFCLIGGIPVIIPYTSKKHSLETRLEASTFIQQLTRSALTLQMFISCRGLRILVELLDEDYALNKTLILSSLEGISSVFELQSPTPRNDFCRMFVREGILDPLSTALLSILKDDDETMRGNSATEQAQGQGQGSKDGDMQIEEEHDSPAQAVGTLLLFCQVAQADARVREAFANRTIMIRLLKACDLLPRKLLVTAIKAIKHLSTSPQLIEVLQNSNAMDILVGLLGQNIKGAHANEICSHIFQTIYSMTRLSKIRQEEAASSGIIPLLKKVIQNKSPLKQFALPILCDLANAGKISRRLLWRYDGMSLYLDLLQDPYWQVSALDAILAWMSDETARVEDVLLDKSASDSLVKCFVQASGVSFEGILDPFLKILRLSSSLTSSISHPPFYSRLADTLERSSKAVVKLNLLRMTRVVCDSHPDRASLIARFGLVDIVEKLSRQDAAVLVRELAKEILPGLLFGGDVPDPLALERIRATTSASPDQMDQHRDSDTGVKIGTSAKATVHGRGEVAEGPTVDEKGTMRRTMSENVVGDALSRHREHAHGHEQRSSTSSAFSTVRAGGGSSGVAGRTAISPTVSKSQSGSADGGEVRSGSANADAGGFSVDRVAQRASLSASVSRRAMAPSPTLHSASSSPTTRLPSSTTRESDRRAMPPPPLPLSSASSSSMPGVSYNTPIHPPASPSSRAVLPAAPGLGSEQGRVHGQSEVPGPERPKHKRKISRNQLREVQWQTDENGKVRSVRTPLPTPAKLAGYTVE